jgi:predicted transcriptional regulator
VEHGYEIELQPERLEILRVLKANIHPMKLSDIATTLGKSITNVQNLLKKMIKTGLVVKTARGIYALAPGLMEPMETVDSMEIAKTRTIKPVNLMDSVDFRHHWS